MSEILEHVAAALPSQAERLAKAAESFTAFSGLNLLHIRRQVTHFLSLIGREGIFDEYTIHDISHIDKMLASLEWIVPSTTKDVMSPTDWLMTTLAIYFHDLGMLVTAREYEARATTDFPRYRDEVLFGGPNGEDYRVKVESLGPDRAERFLYQEWVRHKHAERVKAWVTGTIRDDLGSATEAGTQISKLLAPLGAQFRRDLGLICESHHLNDLNELKKYKLSQPYGNSDAETANLQYCAVLLRTADLLHITSDRTPSTVFKLINPTDPISQQEWAKQMAVTRLRPKTGLNEEGLPDESAPRDTIEVHAYFTSDNGFFGLTSYLAYASKELRQNYEWISTSRKQNLAKHEFPWRKIDDSHIETEGFIRDSFEFTLDQAKILDLLTGHTLYNDTRVVLRELLQNSLDAIRLEFFSQDPASAGRIEVRWDSKERILSVRDNGTGMTQSEISSFLLRVGTSRYQDPEFRKRFPGFSSISRFGIGVLSTFMIADNVEITTCHPEDEQARKLALRSVHGKYLIRTLGKNDPTVQAIAPHGTELRLRVRPSVEMPDVVETAKLWVVVPQCKVTVQVDNAEPVAIGYSSTAEALKALLEERGVNAEIGVDSRLPASAAGSSRTVRVIGTRDRDVDVAVAVEWNEFFREWSFLSSGFLRREENEVLALGTCVEGIRVEMGAPGFDGSRIVAIANVTGPNAPKTNVARSGLEATPERDEVLRRIYAVYCKHVAREAKELQLNRSFSLTWAVEEARFLLKAIYGRHERDSVEAISNALLVEQISQLEVLPIETNGTRKAISADLLSAEPEFWTVESALSRSAEPLIREAGAAASLARIASAIDIPDFEFPKSIVLCGVRPTDWFASFAFRAREVDRIVVNHAQRRVDLRWVRATNPTRWLPMPEQSRRWRVSVSSLRSRLPRNLLVGRDGIEVAQISNEVAVRVFGEVFLLPCTAPGKFLLRWAQHSAVDGGPEAGALVFFLYEIVGQCLEVGGRVQKPEFYVKRFTRTIENNYNFPGGVLEKFGVTDELVDLVGSTTWRLFDPLAWRRDASGGAPQVPYYDYDADYE